MKTTLAIILCFLLISEVVNSLKFQFLIVQTGSMEPNIPTKALIIIKPEHEYQLGDIVTRTDQKVVTHRIVSIQNNKFIQTKGDANEFADPFWITKEQISGKVIGVFPYFQSISYLVTFSGLGILGGKLFRKLWDFGRL